MKDILYMEDLLLNVVVFYTVVIVIGVFIWKTTKKIKYILEVRFEDEEDKEIRLLMTLTTDAINLRLKDYSINRLNVISERIWHLEETPFSKITPSSILQRQSDVRRSLAVARQIESIRSKKVVYSEAMGVPSDYRPSKLRGTNNV